MKALNTLYSRELKELGIKKVMAFGYLGVFFLGLTVILYIADLFFFENGLWVFSGWGVVFMIIMASMMVLITGFWIGVVEVWNKFTGGEVYILPYFAQSAEKTIGAIYGFFTLIYIGAVYLYLQYILPGGAEMTFKIAETSSTTNIVVILGGLLILLTVTTVAMWKEYYDEYLK